MKKLRKLLVASLALTLCLTSAIPAFAQTDTTQESNTTGTKESTVTINSTSSFKVTVPSTITVNQPSKAQLNETYNVKVEGDINGTETIKVVPDSTFNLTQSGKDDVAVTVTQTKQSFAYDEINGVNGLTTQGTLTTTNEVTAGTWTGSFEFNINIETNGLAPGLYETRTTNMLKSWQELLDEGTIHVTDGALKSNYGIGGNSSSAELVGDLVIDNSVTRLAGRAFYGCDNLVKVTIPDSVTAIDGEAFTGLLYLEYHGSAEDTYGNKWGALSVNGYIEGDFIYEDSTKTTLEAAYRTVTTAAIPSSVTTIGNEAFYNCTSLTDVTIPESVTTISGLAFGRCTSLTSVTIPDSVTTIGYNAFLNVPHIEYHGTATGSPWGAQSMN